MVARSSVVALRGALRTFGAITLAWTVFGVVLGEQVYVLQAGREPAFAWSHAVVLEVHYCLVWALVTPVVLRLGVARPLAGNISRRALAGAFAIHLLASVACALTVQAVHALLLCRLIPAWYPRPTLAGVGRSLMSGLDYGFILYWVVTLTGQAMLNRARLTDARVRHAELQEQLADAQLQALRMQMHPHFLFNALNSIAELIHEDAAAAERAVTSLSDLLRIYMRSGEAHEIPLEQEVDFLRRYLEIQKIRFEERLTVHVRLDPAADGAIVPSLILQPLVENAILHGIASRAAGGVVAIEAIVHGGSLALSVADNGAGLAASTRADGRGAGLRNTRRRLERLYGSDQAFGLEAAEGGGARAWIRIPLRRALGTEAL